jgi:hypothetical protein
VDPGTDDDPAFGENAQGSRDEGADRREDDGGVELLRRRGG